MSAPPPVLDMELRAKDETALVTADSVLSVIAQLAANPAVDVAKLDKLIEMQKGILAYQAKAAFDGAFAKMQSELPEISERGKLTVKGTVRSTYAKLEDIQAAIKPVLKAHGFAIRHRTEWPTDRQNVIRIVGILSHEQGHSEESVFEAPMDKSEYRTDIQSMGSTVSYGRRYTTLDLLNITTRGLDDDGGRPKDPPVHVPDGYDDWLSDLASVSDEGLPALQAAWNKSKREYKEHVTKTEPQTWNNLKAKAAKVQAVK